MKQMGQKQRQVANRLHQAVAEHISRGELRDLTGINPVLTATWISKDYTTAKLFFTLLDGADQTDEAEAILEEYGKSIRKKVAGQLKLKFVPQLKFFYDEHGTKAAYVDGIIERVSTDGEA